MDESIIIVGGGLGGLLCALECKRNGFSPVVLESKAVIQSAGDFVLIHKSVTNGFQKWPQLWKGFNEKAWKAEETFHTHTGEVGVGPMPIEYGTLIERSKLHSLLVETVAQEGIEIHCHQRVVDYTEDSTSGSVLLSNGETRRASLVIAADGIHSKSWRIVTGKETQVYSSGEAVYRCAFPVEYAMQNPALREKWQATPETDRVAVFLGPTSHGIMCFTQETAVWIWMHRENAKTSSESWTAKVSTGEALANIDAEGDWAPDFRAMVASTPPNSIVDWKLILRDLQSEWVSPLGRIIQLGDAAHAFMPTSVNGATQAFEDALSLPTCLRLALGTHAPQPWLLGAKVHNKLRIDRVSRLQRWGIQRLNAYREMDWEAVKKNPKGLMSKPLWQTEHDPTSYAEKMFYSCAEALRDGNDFVNTNVQPGYVHKPWTFSEIIDKAEIMNGMD